MKKTEFDINGKVALVTGASSGIGSHFSKVLAERGAKVIVAARRIDRLDALVDDIKKEGGEALAVQMDVLNAESVSTAFDNAESFYGPVTIVSNNAGVTDSRPALEIDEASWDFVLDTNLKGTWLVANEAGRRMVANNIGGSIVNTGSIAGLRVAISMSSYCTSKAAVVQLTKALALEWARKNIRVNALCPGYFKTEMNEKYLTSEHGLQFINNSPAQRTGRMDELTAPFLLLASDAGSFVNGVALPVDGGLSIANL
jgi:NAD(P)-dependent dehydrogenase (short-subunit alcohol dehydrogenase family)